MTNHKEDVLPLHYKDQFREIERKVSNGTLHPKNVSIYLHALLRSPGGFKDLDGFQLPCIDPSEYEVIQSAISSVDFVTRKGQRLKKHPNGGGLVPEFQDENDPNMPFIAETNYVGPNAIITGNVRMFGKNTLRGYVRFSGSIRVVGNNQFLGNIWASGKFVITGNNRFSGNVTLFGDNIWIAGRNIFTDDVWVTGSPCIFGDSQICDDAWIFGDAQIANSYIGGSTKVGGKFKGIGRQILAGTYLA